MLTIGQLAAYVGVTVRAIRHYHQRGLLAEPDRDASGYRRYDGQAVIELIRIKTLSEAGVPLARIEELLSADPEQFRIAIAQIDAALRKRIRDIRRHRRQIAGLVAGERLFLPAEVVDYLDHLRMLGVSQRTVQLERNGWIVLMASSPGQVPGWAKDKQSALANAEFRQLYLACDQAFGWDPADPRLEKLADDITAFAAQQRRGLARAPGDWTINDPVAIDLLSSQNAGISPSWERLMQLCQLRAQAAGLA
jgi:DNA-binding transcriptional MerR regulator